MDFTSIITAALPFIVDALKGALTHVTPTEPPLNPPPLSTTVPVGTTPYPRDFIKSVQTFANKVMSFIDPSATPLAVDGWAGKKTEAALNAILAAAKKYGVG